MAVESVNPYASIATRDNIVRDNNDPLPDAYVEARARQDIDARLTGDFSGGRVVTDAEAAAGEVSASVTEIQEGAAGIDKYEIWNLPEDVSGTWTVTLTHSGGSGTTIALDADASASTVQGAVNTVTGSALEVVVAKAASKRTFVVGWTSDGEDLTDFAVSTIAFTETGERGLDNN